MTDAEREIRFDPEGKPGVSNLLTIYSALTGRDIDGARRRVRGQGLRRPEGGPGRASSSTSSTPFQARVHGVPRGPRDAGRVLADGADRAAATLAADARARCTTRSGSCRARAPGSAREAAGASPATRSGSGSPSRAGALRRGAAGGAGAVRGPVGGVHPAAHHAAAAPRSSSTTRSSAVDEHLAAVAARHAPFVVKLRGTATFRPVSPVVFVQLVEGVAGLRAASRRASGRGCSTQELRFQYHPHVTVAHEVPDDQLDAAFAAGRLRRRVRRRQLPQLRAR